MAQHLSIQNMGVVSVIPWLVGFVGLASSGFVVDLSAKNPGVDTNDLVMTATEGLLIAINRWSFEKSDASGERLAAELKMENEENGRAPGEGVLPRGSRLATYAMWWMRVMLTDSVIENSMAFRQCGICGRVSRKRSMSAGNSRRV